MLRVRSADNLNIVDHHHHPFVQPRDMGLCVVELVWLADTPDRMIGMPPVGRHHHQMMEDRHLVLPMEVDMTHREVEDMHLVPH